MAVAGNADPMLGYLTTSFREHPELRQASGTPHHDGDEQRSRARGASERADRTESRSTPSTPRRAATAGPSTRCVRKARPRSSGCAGAASICSVTRRYAAPPRSTGDLCAGAAGAVRRRSMPASCADVSPRHVRVRTPARDRDDYLAHPKSGESIRADDAERIVSALASAGSRRPQVQIVISDGLNANAVNGQLRAVLPPLRRELAAAGIHTGERRRRDPQRARARGLSRRRARRCRRRRALHRRAAGHRARHAVGVSHLRPRRRRPDPVEQRARSRRDDGRLRHSPARENLQRAVAEIARTGAADRRDEAFGRRAMKDRRCPGAERARLRPGTVPHDGRVLELRHLVLDHLDPHRRGHAVLATAW